jgi:hypothetical protein
MKTVIFIPTYWTRESHKGVKWTDVPHDHPTPIDKAGTLERAVLSLKTLEDRDFVFLVMAASSSESMNKQAQDRVLEILRKCCPSDIQTYVFSHPHLDLLKNYFKEHGGSEFLRYLDIHGYSNMRNLSLILAQLLNADIMVSLDDDEYVTDPRFLSKAKENIGKTVNGIKVDGVTGYYIDQSGDYHVSQKDGEWMKHWNKADVMNRTFDKFISRPPRLKLTPFALGGCMVHGRKLMERIPYDPLIQRGEDIDYLINARMFGLNVFLDNKLSVVHDPPPKQHPLWRQFMIDAIRFVYERQKILSQKKVIITAEDLEPYPGEFLKNDLEEKIKLASTALSEEFFEKGEDESADFSLEIPRMASLNTKLNPYTHLVELRSMWKRLTSFIRESDLRKHEEFFYQLKI